MDKTISHIGRIVALRIFYDMVRDILLEKGKALFIKELVPLLEEKGLRLPRKLVRYLIPMWEEGVVEEGSVNIRYRKEQVSRPLEGDIETILKNIGKPIPLKILSQELAIVQKRLPEVYLQSLPSLLSSRAKKYFVLGDKAGLRRWLLQVERGAKEEDIVFYNFMDEEIKELEEWLAMPPLKGEKPIEEIKALLRERGAISHKVFSFLVWRARGSVDSLRLMKEMFEDGGFLMIKEATWVNKEQIPAAVALLKEIEIPPGAVEPEPFIFGKDEQEMFLSYIEGKDIISISKSARELFELEDVDMKQVEETLKEFLKGREGLLWVGGDKWIKLEKIPTEILAIPEEVEIDREFQYEDLDGEQLEVELSDEGLEDALPQLLKDPIIQDTGDEEEIEVSPPQEEIQLVIPYHHYIAGTLPVRQWEKSFYPSEPRLQSLAFLHDDEEIELWYNQDLPLIFGLKEWYKNNLPPSGGIIKVRKVDEGVYRLIWEGETHPLLSISQKRLNDLLKLREELIEQPTIEVIQTLLEYHKRAHFFTILSEVNIIRRTPKRRVASILSIFPCFYIREKEEGYFYYDSAKRDEVMKRSKKKYILTK
ncbi:hypothetical protein H5T88_01275 [bacterium]|nr:hypothetical protein [bacterium]